MRVSVRRFEELVAEALDSIPEEFSRRIENLEVEVEGEPPPELLYEMGIDPPDTLLGLYRGVPLDDRGLSYGNVLPDKITLFKGPLERMSHSHGELVRNIRVTVVHEVGHYFGLSDEELKKYEPRG